MRTRPGAAFRSVICTARSRAIRCTASRPGRCRAESSRCSRCITQRRDVAERAPLGDVAHQASHDLVWWVLVAYRDSIDYHRDSIGEVMGKLTVHVLRAVLALVLTGTVLIQVLMMGTLI